MNLFQMNDGREYPRASDALAMKARVRAPEEITQFNLLATNHRLAAIVATTRNTKISVWNWMNGKPCLVSPSIPHLK